MSQTNAEALVARYRELRDQKAEYTKDYKAKVASVEEELDQVSAQLLDICNAHSIESLRTDAGTAMRRTITKYWTSDWERMYQFIREHDAFHLLEQRVHSKHMEDFLDENPDLMPIGLNVDRKFVISVRKPTNK
jgi:NTP pyrophosphatase (non-canonical NTP hydrolase)